MPQLNLIKKYPVIMGALVLTILSIGLVVALALSRQSQDIRQQASVNNCGVSCTSNDQCTGGTRCWQSQCINPMCKLNPGVCDAATRCNAIVSCGSPGCKIGQSVCASGTCVDDGGAGYCDCTTASPSPSPGVSPSPGGASCTTFTISDFNQDCRSTIDDYQLFIQDYIQEQN